MRSTKILALATLATTLMSAQLMAATWNVGASGDYATIQAAIGNAAVTNGDTLIVEAGTYATSVATLTINKQLTIEGAGMGQTIITHGPSASASAVDVTADNVTLRNLTIAFGNGESSIYNGSGLKTNRANLTIDGVEFALDYAVSGILLFNGSSDITIRNSSFNGNLNREMISILSNSTATPGTVLIENNVFEQIHFQQGSILVGGPSGADVVIRNNYFASGVGVLDEFGEMPNDNYGFQSDGDLLYGLQIGELATGRTVDISNNTFVFEDAETLNRYEMIPLMRGIQSTAASYEVDQVLVQDNIFSGFHTGFEDSVIANPYIWHPSGGQHGGAIEFNGANGFGEFTSNSSFDVGAKGTFSAWVNLKNTNKRNQLMEGPGNANIELQYRPNSGGQFFGRIQDDSDFVIRSGPDGPAVQDQWALLQYTWDFTVGEMHIYLNGAESGYITNFSPTTLNWTSAVDTTRGIITIGTDPSNSSRTLDGLMDDVAFYDDVLDSTELANVGTSGVSADARLVAHWNFDETTGAVAADSSGNSLNLQLRGDRAPNLGQVYAVLTTAPITLDNNLYFDTDTVYANGATDANSVLADPLFLVAGDTPERFALSSGSPAIGAGNGGDNIGAFQGTPPAQPGIDTNAGLTVGIDRTRLITSSLLSSSDADSNDADLVYTITSAPTLGTVSPASFTQGDLDNGLVTYANTAAGSTDSFEFSVSDGITAPVTGTFTITLDNGPDSDRDGIPDAEETANGTLPNNKDSDSDGIEDGLEVAIGTNPNSNGDPADTTDADGDGIPDSLEPGLGLDPSEIDEDGDGYRDGYEIAQKGIVDLTGVPSLGDTNPTPGVDNTDAVKIIEIFLGLGTPSAPDKDMDLNRDGSIDNVDAIILFNYIVGNITTIPFPF